MPCNAEGQDTETDYQASLFSKLTVAYVVNLVLVPLAIGFLQSGNTSGHPVDQVAIGMQRSTPRHLVFCPLGLRAQLAITNAGVVRGLGDRVSALYRPRDQRVRLRHLQNHPTSCVGP